MSNPTLPSKRCGAIAAAVGRADWRLRAFVPALAVALLAALPFSSLRATDLSAVPLPTYTVGSTVDIKPNIMMVLDDSGSMDWDYLPDWANDNPPNHLQLADFLTRNSVFNGLSYNPAITYLPALTFDSTGAKISYTNQNGATVAAGANTGFTVPNWRQVKIDAFGIQSTSTRNLQTTALEQSRTSGDFGATYAPWVDASGCTPGTSNNGRTVRQCRTIGSTAWFYTTLAGEHCDSPAMTNCTVSSAPTGNFTYPSPLRWCNSAALTTCRALQDSTYSYPRIAAPLVATIRITSANNAAVTGVTVGTAQIMNAATAANSTIATVAQRVVDQINACTYSLPSTTNCSAPGYSAFVTGTDTVNILAPGVTPGTVAIAHSGTMNRTISQFASARVPLAPWLNGSNQSTDAIPGSTVLTVIYPGNTSYAYPGTAAKHPSRTDCAGTTCTYNEEMTNYANWYSYYRTRMQMMKTSTSRAFANLDSDENIAANRTRFRVGYLTLNNNTQSDFVNIKNFDTTQKVTWFSKLLSANPANGTPLRVALSKAGQIYAGVHNGTQMHGVTVEEPLEFSCQKNYTILSTDGFWNGNAGAKLDKTTLVGNQDGLLPRPYNDGTTAQVERRTATLQTRVNTQAAQKGLLQKRTLQIQAMEHRLQASISTNNGGSYGAWNNVSSCTPDNSGNTRTQCRYLDSAWTNVGSCNAVAKDTSGTWNTSVARSCQTPVTAAWADVTSCSPGTSNGGLVTECQYRWEATAGTAICTPTSQTNFTNPTVYRNCATTNGTATNATTTCTPNTTPDANGRTTQCFYTAWSNWATVGSCSAAAQSTGTSFSTLTATECRATSAGGTSNTLADVAAYYYATDLRDSTATGTDATGSCTGPVIPPATTPSDLCENNVQSYGRDSNPKQHMTTHTLGLGVQGQMVYSPYQNTITGQRTYIPDYWTQPSGDFYSVANGSVANPGTGICPWLALGTPCTWPTPAADASANIDDLWHAAVNGRGTYFSATDPSGLGAALTGVLKTITNTPRPGTAAAAASSNPNITSSDNYVFSSSYRSVEWFGELIMQRFGADDTLSEQQWSAMQLLDCATTPWTASHTYQVGQAFSRNGVCYVVESGYTSTPTFGSGDTDNTRQLTSAPFTRNIFTPGGVATSGLTPFTWTGLSTAQKAYFEASNINYVSPTVGLSQFCTTGPTCLSAPAQTSAAGESLVNFLRGDRANEGSYYRSRVHVLGDIVSAEARYVKAPLQNYADEGYAEFRDEMADRSATVYVGANDGMLHAFEAETGRERWAFIPSAVLPEMYRLADIDYGQKHRFFVDGTPEVGEICPTAPTTACDETTWRTMLVGGLNQGGKAFYALDITDPESPRLMWEFTNAQMGFSYSNPRITKLANGTWVVIVASGYNNADGIGRLFVLNAATGALINTISTGVGSAANPSGLTKLAVRASNGSVNNTLEQVYGGDLLGNVWRFDLNNVYGTAGTDAHLLVNLQDPNGNPQPITAKPTVTSVNGNPLVLVGTGRYLGLTDLPDTTTFSMYAIQDKLNVSTTLTTPRNGSSNFVQQVMAGTTCPADAPSSICTQGQVVRTTSANPVDFSVKNGWYFDFLIGGERAVTDPSLALGTLVLTTIKPQAATAATVVGCTGDEGGVNAKSYLYYLNYLTGGAVEGTKNVVGEELCVCIATRPSVVRTQSGNVEGIIRLSGGGQSEGTDMGVTRRENLPYAPGGAPNRRISWRLLNGE